MADCFDDTLEESKNPALGFFATLRIPNRDATRLKEIEASTTQASSAIDSVRHCYTAHQKIFENSKLALFAELGEKQKSVQAMIEAANQTLPDISFSLPSTECCQLDETLTAFDEALKSPFAVFSEKLQSPLLLTEAQARIPQAKAGGVFAEQYQQAALVLPEEGAAVFEPLTQTATAFMSSPSVSSLAATELFTSPWGNGFTDKLEKTGSVFHVSNVSTTASIQALEQERAELRVAVEHIDAALKGNCPVRVNIDPPIVGIPEELFAFFQNIQQRERENRQRLQQKFKFIKRKLRALLRAVNALLKRLIQNASGPPTVGGLASLSSFARIFLCVSKIPGHSSPESAIAFAA